MQRVDDYKKEGPMTVNDLLLAEVHAGETVVIHRITDTVQ